MLPFSLDAALNATIAPEIQKARSSGSQKWDFKIYEDTPEEEAATFMEQSTLTLDLSSDDESTALKNADRGKENTPPEDYVAPVTRSRLQAASQANNSADKMAEDPLPRAPLLEVSSSYSHPKMVMLIVSRYQSPKYR